MKFITIWVSVFLFVCSLNSLTPAAIIASDNAADAAYNSGFSAGSNGGNGFTTWTFPDTGGSFGVGDSSSNGATDSTGDINAPQSKSGRAWALAAASGGAIVVAARNFNEGVLGVGQTFSFDMDAGTIASGGLIGFDLGNASVTVTGFGAQQGIADYYLVDNSNSRLDTGVPVTDRGVHAAFTLTSSTTYSAAITPTGSSTTIINGTLTNLSSDHSISEIDLVDYQAGNQTTNVAYFNNLSISVPEPASILMLAMAVPMLVSRRRSRRV